mgnify:CR=1 FL=1
MRPPEQAVYDRLFGGEEVTDAFEALVEALEGVANMPEGADASIPAFIHAATLAGSDLDLPELFVFMDTWREAYLRGLPPNEVPAAAEQYPRWAPHAHH